MFFGVHFSFNKYHMDTKTEQDILWESLSFFESRVEPPATLPKEVEQLEIQRIQTALDLFDGNRSKAAGDLGIGRTNLIAKIKKYNL